MRLRLRSVRPGLRGARRVRSVRVRVRVGIRVRVRVRVRVSPNSNPKAKAARRVSPGHAAAAEADGALGVAPAVEPAVEVEMVVGKEEEGTEAEGGSGRCEVTGTELADTHRQIRELPTVGAGRGDRGGRGGRGARGGRGGRRGLGASPPLESWAAPEADRQEALRSFMPAAGCS